jgi:hypothetical protein
MQDDFTPADIPAVDEVLPDEPGAAGEIVKRSRFGIGSRAAIMMGLTIGAVSAMSVVAAFSRSVSNP